MEDCSLIPEIGIRITIKFPHSLLTSLFTYSSQLLPPPSPQLSNAIHFLPGRQYIYHRASTSPPRLPLILKEFKLRGNKKLIRVLNSKYSEPIHRLYKSKCEELISSIKIQKDRGIFKEKFHLSVF